MDIQLSQRNDYPHKGDVTVTARFMKAGTNRYVNIAVSEAELRHARTNVLRIARLQALEAALDSYYEE